MKKTNRRRFIVKSTLSVCGMALSGNSLKDIVMVPSSLTNLGQSEKSLIIKLSGIKQKHPSLHFDDERLKDLQRLATSTHKLYADKLYQWVDENKDWIPPTITGENGDEVLLEECAAYVTNSSIAFCLSRNPEYFNLTVKWALEMCKYPKDAIRNYSIGIYAAGLARVYDWLYHDLDFANRQLLKTAIKDIVTRMYEGSFSGASGQLWWANAYLHHDHWIAVGGYGEAALSLLGEFEEADIWAAHAKMNFDNIFTWLGDDGAWHEGAADWCYTVAPLLWFYGAWVSVVNENPHNIDWIKNTATYRLYHWLPDNSYIYLNDSFRSGRYSTSGGASCHLLRRLASINKDGYAQWLAEKDEIFDYKPSPKGVYQAPYEKLSFLGEPKEYLNPVSQVVGWNILWYDPTVKSKDPTNLPLSHHFTNEGIVIMRTGWNANETVVSFSCAPIAGQASAKRVRNGERIAANSYGHEHLDFNSFTLFANGQYFIIPPGYARRASYFQNVVSVNGNGYNVNPEANIKILGYINGRNFIYTVGDATEAFLPEIGVNFYRRHLLLINDWLIIFDDLLLSNVGRRTSIFNYYTSTVYSDPKNHTIEIDSNRVSWWSKNRNQQPLTMFMLEPSEFAWELGTLQSNLKKLLLEKLQFTKPEWNSNKMQTISAWSWGNQPKSPILYKNKGIVAVILGNQTVIGFSLTPGIPIKTIDSDLREYELLLFGHDPLYPNSYVVFKGGKQLK